ncbi:ATP-binding protein [Phenylobacterium sp. LjRoot225]|uniref:AAA family ATPase n=1 Tax=Phenylobacterium sp. LjRoot225 TaxID=3342285 RepID=UPI003ED0D5EC
MKVVYRGRSSRRVNPDPTDDGDVIELLTNNWDDYGHKTTFVSTSRIQGQIVELGSIKLMIEDVFTTSTELDHRLKVGWDGSFPLENANYLSTPTEITFYQQISEILGVEIARSVALQLRDASLLIHETQDPSATGLMSSSTFKKSLQRERGEQKTFLDGWKIFARQQMAVLDLGFRFEDVFGQISTLGLKFQSEGPLPHDVNVLIGTNGAGKSQILHQIVRDWVKDGDRRGKTGFAEKPNLSQMVVVSYSPFEKFPVDLSETKLQDKSIYRYFGFRAPRQDLDGRRRIVLTHDAPKRDAAASLLDCLTDDQRYRSFPGWTQKLKTAEQVLRSAFAFDVAAVRIKIGKELERYTDDLLTDNGMINIADGAYAGRYLPIASADVPHLKADAVQTDMLATHGVTFFKDGMPVELSSGQRLFSFIVINILGAIRRDSLVLIDEPELFLHPALEIRFIGMLKQILDRFNSKALVATHSEVTVREVPSACVHVLERTTDGLVVRKPPFQTFGGDVQRISSYVFGDSATSKPFEGWIREQLEEHRGADALIEALGEDINEELVIQIRGLDRLRRDEDVLW